MFFDIFNVKIALIDECKREDDSWKVMAGLPDVFSPIDKASCCLAHGFPAIDEREKVNVRSST